MKLSREQLVELDGYDWFGEDFSDLWGETAYEALTAGYDGRGDLDSHEFTNYVRYTMAVMPEFAPSAGFCRRVALWWDGYRPYTLEEAESASPGDVTRLVINGMLPRFDDVVLSTEEIGRVIASLADGTRGASDWAWLDAILNHPSVASQHLDYFWEEAENRDRMTLEALPYLAAHPLASRKLLKAVQELVIRQMKNRPDQMGEWRWKFCYELAAKHLAIREELPFWERLKFARWKNSKLRFSDYYLGGMNPLTQDLMLLPAGATFEDIALANASWVKAFTEKGPESEEAKLVGLAYGAGGDGVPSALALVLALRWWAAVTSDRPEELIQRQRPVWLAPYIEGAIRWAYSLEGGAFKDIPFEWVAETLDLDAGLAENHLMLSSEWLDGATSRTQPTPSL